MLAADVTGCSHFYKKTDSWRSPSSDNHPIIHQYVPARYQYIMYQYHHSLCCMYVSYKNCWQEPIYATKAALVYIFYEYWCIPFTVLLIIQTSYTQWLCKPVKLQRWKMNLRYGAEKIASLFVENRVLHVLAKKFQGRVSCCSVKAGEIGAKLCTVAWLLLISHWTVLIYCPFIL